MEITYLLQRCMLRSSLYVDCWLLGCDAPTPFVKFFMTSDSSSRTCICHVNLTVAGHVCWSFLGKRCPCFFLKNPLYKLADQQIGFFLLMEWSTWFYCYSICFCMHLLKSGEFLVCVPWKPWNDSIVICCGHFCMFESVNRLEPPLWSGTPLYK